MRIKLKRGFQKNLILLAKANRGWKELAEKVGTSPGYLKNDLKNEHILLPEEAYKKLCSIAKVEYDGFIEEKLENNWGRSKGGKNASQNNPPKILLHRHSKELAELIGIILGDGNIWAQKGGYHYVRIAGDKIKDKDYLTNYVNSLFNSLFKTKMHVRISNKTNKISLEKGSRDIVFTLNYFGIPSGNKKANDVKIPDWILDSKDYTKACVRGLIDTDGSVAPINGRNYPYIWFSCNIPNLRESFEIAFKNLGLKLSKWNIRKGHAAECYIGNKKDIARFLKEIGFSNLKHRKKFQCPVSAAAKFLN